MIGLFGYYEGFAITCTQLEQFLRLVLSLNVFILIMSVKMQKTFTLSNSQELIAIIITGFL